MNKQALFWFILGSCTLLSGSGGNSFGILVRTAIVGVPYIVIIFCYTMILRKKKKFRNNILRLSAQRVVRPKTVFLPNDISIQENSGSDVFNVGTLNRSLIEKTVRRKRRTQEHRISRTPEH